MTGQHAKTDGHGNVSTQITGSGKETGTSKEPPHNSTKPKN